VRISAAYELVNLNRDGVDVAVRLHKVDGATLPGERLFGDVVLPVCSPKLLRDKARPLKTPEDLRHHVLLYLDSGPGADMQDWPIWLRAMKLDGLKPASVLHFSQFDQLINAAVAGQGIALGPQPAAAGSCCANASWSRRSRRRWRHRAATTWCSRPAPRASPRCWTSPAGCATKRTRARCPG
jgi:DNA-binding transcriptional LysR family regulator